MVDFPTDLDSFKRFVAEGGIRHPILWYFFQRIEEDRKEGKFQIKATQEELDYMAGALGISVAVLLFFLSTNPDVVKAMVAGASDVASNIMPDISLTGGSS